uniref:Heparan sulfate glucosamine 3-O-sulfotransferase 5 n=1 Tax=Strigamia maritima TaxID=126957 RepID=T1J8M9_STRMM
MYTSPVLELIQTQKDKRKFLLVPRSNASSSSEMTNKNYDHPPPVQTEINHKWHPLEPDSVTWTKVEVSGNNKAQQHPSQEEWPHEIPFLDRSSPLRCRLLILCALTSILFATMLLRLVYFHALDISSAELCSIKVAESHPQMAPYFTPLTSPSSAISNDNDSYLAVGGPRREKMHFSRTRRQLPQCIIIGVRKCGTRALLEFLNLHQRIQKAAVEMHFFDDDQRYRLGLEWYRKRMPYSFADQITVEKSPAYFVTPAVPERIKAMNSSVKLLLIVRDPVTRTISDYAQIHSNKLTKGKPHEPFEAFALTPDGQVNTQYRAIQISIYVKYLKMWFDVFGREQIHIVDGDQLVDDPYPELQKIEDFLRLEHRITRENFYFNKTKGFFCLRNETTEKCLGDTKGRKHPQVPAHVVHKLRQFFQPYNQHFYDKFIVIYCWINKSMVIVVYLHTVFDK